MKPKKNGLSSSETEILKLIHHLYGRRHHRPQECFTSEEGGEKYIFIKTRNGEALFSVNLTFLAAIQHSSTVQIQENYLMPVINGKPRRSTCPTESSGGYLKLHPKQSPQDDYSPGYERMAS